MFEVRPHHESLTKKDFAVIYALFLLERQTKGESQRILLFSAQRIFYRFPMGEALA